MDVKVLGQLGYRSPLTAASATFALKAGVWFRRGRLFMVSPVRGDYRRLQAEIPLSDLFKFAEPALFSGPKQILLEQLDESGHVPEDDFVTLAMEYVISFKLKKSEMTRSIELSKQCRVDLDESLVKSSWSELVAKVGLISKGCLHLIGPEAKDGLIFQDRSRSTAEDGQCCVWFSLGGRNTKPFTVDLKKPSFLDDESPIQYPLKSAASASEHGRPFVTLLDFQLAGMLYIFDWPLKGSHEFFTRPILVNSQHC